MQSRRRTKRKVSLHIAVRQRTEWRPKTSAFSASGQFCARAGVRAETTGLCGIRLPCSPAIQQHVGLLLFWNFFLSDKEKSGTFSFYKRLFLKALSVRKEKVERFSFTALSSDSRKIMCMPRTVALASPLPVLMSFFRPDSRRRL